MTNASNDTDPVTEQKLTAEQINEDCPVMLEDWGKRIAAHADKARKCEEKAGQHYNSIAQLLAAAQRACNDGGFTAFRGRFLPELGKSRVYELLAIAKNKKSVEETKANTRERVAKHRANKAAGGVSATVTETPEPEALGATTENGGPETSSLVPEQVPEPPRSPSGVNPRDYTGSKFNTYVLELDRITNKKPPERFADTAVPADILARLGQFLTDVADLKKPSGSTLMPLASSGTVSSEQSTEEAKTEHDDLKEEDAEA
jgi:hypothetical protein